MKPTNPEVIDLGHGDRVSVEFYSASPKMALAQQIPTPTTA